MLDEVKYTNNRTSPFYFKDIEKRMEKLGFTNKELLELAIVKSNTQRLAGQNWKETLFLQNTDYKFCNSSRETISFPGTYATIVNTFVPEKEYIEQFFKEYLGIVVNCSRFLLKIPSFGQGIERFSNIVFIVNSLVTILNESVFKVFFKYTTYKEFCDNLFLNLLYHKLYDSNRARLVVIYFILFMKDFNVRDLLISERRDLFSNQYRTNPTQNMWTCFSHCSQQEKQIIEDSLLRGKKYINSIVTEHWPKDSASNIKRSVTGCATWLSTFL